MMSRIPLAGLMAVAALLLSACGGGGGGGSPKIPNLPAISLSTSSVQQSADFPSGVASSVTIVVTGTNLPEDDIYVGLDYSTNGIANAYFTGTSDTQGLITIDFRAPMELQPGTYTDTLTFHTCYDDQCARPLPGTPKDIAVTYTVTGRVSSATIDTTTFAVTGNLRTQQAPPAATANITVTPPTAIPPTVVLASSSNLVQNIAPEQVSNSGLRLRLDFRAPQIVGPIGTYQETLSVRLCYDYSCALELQGSPFALNVTYEVTDNALPEPGVTQLPYLTRTELPHNVVDAEYSAALESIVMVSSSPTNSLYVYDVTTGTSRELRLNQLPTSVSVAPDGLTAAVGHDALITHVDLTTVGQVGAPAPTLLNVSANVFDIVLDGHGVVHAMPLSNQSVNLRSVTVATNVETLNTGGLIRHGARIRLHPSDDYLYLADDDLSPSDIAKIDIRTLPATWLYDSPYQGTYAICGDLWMKGDGTAIYTNCGPTFSSSTTQSQDMLYGGRLELASTAYGVTIESLSQSEATDEIALIELVDTYTCSPYVSTASQCYTHFNLYDSNSLNRTAIYTIPPIAVDNRTFSQRGMFVFHSSDGLHRYMISRLVGLPNNGEQFYVTQQQ